MLFVCRGSSVLVGMHRYVGMFENIFYKGLGMAWVQILTKALHTVKRGNIKTWGNLRGRGNIDPRWLPPGAKNHAYSNSCNSLFFGN